MSLLQRIMGGATSVPPPARREPVIAASAGETSGTGKPAPWLQEIGWGASSRSRVKSLPPVSPASAERHATVFSCCNVIAGDLAKLPLKLYQRDDEGQEHRVREHAANYLLNVESSPGVPASVMRFAAGYIFALRGNAHAYAPRDGAGELELIETILPQKITMLRAGRERVYDFEDGAGALRRVPARTMMHLRYLALDGWTGRSPIEVAAESLGIALAGQEAAARMVSGSNLKGYVKLEDVFDTDDDLKRNEARIKDVLNSPDGGLPILYGNSEIHRLDLSAADQELLASRKLDREQIASIYRVPPTKLQLLEFGVKANSEQAALDYLSDCLLHWAKQVEDQMMLSLLTPAERMAGLFFRHDFDTMLRPSTRERFESYHRAVGGPIMTANEARRKEGLATIEGGDLLYPPPNMTRPDAQTNAQTEGGKDA